MCSHSTAFPALLCKEEDQPIRSQAPLQRKPLFTLRPLKWPGQRGSWRTGAGSAGSPGRVCPGPGNVWETMCSLMVSLNLVPGKLQQMSLSIWANSNNTKSKKERWEKEAWSSLEEDKAWTNFYPYLYKYHVEMGGMRERPLSPCLRALAHRTAGDTQQSVLVFFPSRSCLTWLVLAVHLVDVFLVIKLKSFIFLAAS